MTWAARERRLWTSSDRRLRRRKGAKKLVAVKRQSIRIIGSLRLPRQSLCSFLAMTVGSESHLSFISVYLRRGEKAVVF